MSEFLIHGVKYSFPARTGALERGVPTSHSAPVLNGELVMEEQDVYVWPYAKGKIRGTGIRPLSEHAPEAALKDRKLYDLLALVDAIRIGKARERKLAIQKLNALLEERNGHAEYE